MYKVSVIIPTYNLAEFTENAIESVVNQTIGFENIELILVDDNSPDDTPKIIKKYCEKYDNVKGICLKENHGSPSNGRNIGIDEASSKYVMFLDADDLYDKDICKNLYEAIEKYDSNVAGCRYVSCTNEGNLKLHDDLFGKSSVIVDNPKNNLTFFKDIYIWNKIFNVEFLRKYNIYFPSNALLEDLYFMVQINLYNDCFVFINDYYGYYYNIRDADDSSTSYSISYNSFKKLLKGFEDTFKILEKYDDSKVLTDGKSEFYGILIRSFIIITANNQEKIELLEKIYNIIKTYGIDSLNVAWENFFYQSILNRRFKLVIYLAKIVNSIENSAYARKLYRKYFRKIK